MWCLPAPRLLAAALLFTGAGLPFALGQNSPDLYSQHMDAGVDALIGRRYIVAANEFRIALGLQPDSSQAALLAGEALVYGREPAQALPVLLRAAESESDSVMVHELLASAYAALDKPVERDAQCAVLRNWVTDGRHPTLTHVPSFLLETLWLGTWHVNATDYLEPDVDDPVFFRFIVRDRAEIIEGSYCVTPWHGDAGASVSAYALRACNNADAPPLQVYATLPDYSLLRNTMIETLKHSLPVARR